MEKKLAIFALYDYCRHADNLVDARGDRPAAEVRADLVALARRGPRHPWRRGAHVAPLAGARRHPAALPRPPAAAARAARRRGDGPRARRDRGLPGAGGVLPARGRRRRAHARPHPRRAGGGLPRRWREAGRRHAAHQRAPGRGRGPRAWPRVPAAHGAGGVRALAPGPRGAADDARAAPLHAVAGGAGAAPSSTRAAGWCRSSRTTARASRCGCCAQTYAGILDAIERLDWDVFRSRAYVSTPRKLVMLGRAVLSERLGTLASSSAARSV